MYFKPQRRCSLCAWSPGISGSQATCLLILTSPTALRQAPTCFDLGAGSNDRQILQVDLVVAEITGPAPVCTQAKDVAFVPWRTHQLNMMEKRP